MKNYPFIFLVSTLFFCFTACDTEDKTEDNETEENGTVDIESVTFTGQIYTCSDISVNVIQSDEENQTALLMYGAGKDDLLLTEEVKTFDLPLENLQVVLRDYDLPLTSSHFCNDIAFDPWPQLISEWAVVSGTISMSVSNIDDSPQAEPFTFYDLSILLENAVFENENGDQLMVEELELEDLGMGFLPAG